MSAATAPLLQVHALNAWYGAIQVLFEISLEVAAGEVVALMGRNGAGKSSTLKAIMGLTTRRAGSVRFLGREMVAAEPHTIARAGLGWVPEDRRIFTDLTVRENLEVGRQPPRRAPDGRSLPAWDEAALFKLFPNLAGMTARPASQMSGGEQQMLTVARTLMGQPLAVLLDEPSEGVAPVIVEEMARSVLAMKAQGLGVLLSEQNLDFAARVADRVVLLERGQVVHQAGMAEMLADEGLRRRYLGV